MSEGIQVTVLGAGQSIGKSCFLLSVNGLHVLLDCGSYVGKDTKKGLPEFAKLPKGVTVNELSAVLISHFHMDHIGGLVYLTEHLKYKGPIFASGPTRAVFPILLRNNRSLLSNQMQTAVTMDLFANLVKRIREVSVRETVHINDRLQVTAHIAGHVIGAVMWEVKMDDRTILYTGDYSDEDNQFLPSYQLPQHLLLPNQLDMLIMECTYGNTVFKSFQARQTELLDSIVSTVREGGRVLIPCYAIGFTQVVIAMTQKALLSAGLKTPVFCSSPDSLSVLPIYNTFSSWVKDALPLMAETVQQFRLDFLDSSAAFVLFAPSASMTTGVSRTAFERLATDARNTVIILGQNSPDSFVGQMMKDGAKLPSGAAVLCRRKIIPFSAHPDRASNERFIERTHPESVVLVHGDRGNCAGFIKHFTATHDETPLLMMPETGKSVVFSPVRRHVRLPLRQLAHLRRETAKRRCVTHALYCAKGEATLTEGVAIPLVNRVVIACSSEKAREVKSRLDATTDGIAMEYVDGKLRITWEEGVRQRVASLLSRLSCVCYKQSMCPRSPCADW